MSKRDSIDEQFEQFSRLEINQSTIIRQLGYKDLKDFLTEYYRRGYAMPENPDKEENQKIIRMLASLFTQQSTGKI